jgi:hypothetical protein
MKPTKFQAAATLIAAAATLASPQFTNANPADGGYPGASMIRAGSWYISAGGGFDYMKLPRYDGNVFTAGNSAPTISFEPKVFAGGPDATLGYIFKDGTMPAWMGRNFRLEFGFLYRKGAKSSTATNQSAGGGTIFQVDGTSTAFAFGPNGSTQGSLSADHSRWQLALTARSDYKVAPAWLLSPFISIHGGMGDTDYTGRIRSFVATAAAGAVFQDSLMFESVKSWHVGFRTGVNLVWKIRHDLRLYVGGFGGLAYQHSSYNGTSCQGANSVSLSSCSGNLVARATASDSASTIAFVGGVTAGARWRIGRLIVALSGGFRYNTAMPGIRHPSPSNPAAASLTHKGGHAFTGSLRVIIPFSTGG